MSNVYQIDVKQVLVKLGLKYRVVGNNLQLPCPNPMHHDSTKDGGSFYVHTHDLVFNCFGCDWKGSIFTLIMLYLNIGFDEAISWLKEDGNFNFDSKEFLRLELGKRLKQDILEEITDERNPFFLPKVTDITSERIFQFFKKRHISKRIALFYGAKVCLEGFYQNRIIIPILEQGKLHGFEARIIDKSWSNTKCLYPVNSTLKNTIFDRDSLNLKEILYFTEGMMDCLSLKSRGYHNSSCSFGSKLKKPQVDILNTFQTICLIPDNDVVAEGKTKGGEELVNKFYTSVRMPEVFVVRLPPGRDVDELPQEELHKRINERVSISDYIVDRDLRIHNYTLDKSHLLNSSRLKKRN